MPLWWYHGLRLRGPWWTLGFDPRNEWGFGPVLYRMRRAPKDYHLLVLYVGPFFVSVQTRRRTNPW